MSRQRKASEKAYGKLLDHVNINDAEGLSMDNDNNITFDDFRGNDIDEIESATAGLVFFF